MNLHDDTAPIKYRALTARIGALMDTYTDYQFEGGRATLRRILTAVHAIARDFPLPGNGTNPVTHHEKPLMTLAGTWRDYAAQLPDKREADAYVDCAEHLELYVFYKMTRPQPDTRLVPVEEMLAQLEDAARTNRNVDAEDAFRTARIMVTDALSVFALPKTDTIGADDVAS